MKVAFEEVALKAKKQWKENGRSRTETKKFYQTLSQFNRNSDGTVKTREQIMVELCAERDAWLAA